MKNEATRQRTADEIRRLSEQIGSLVSKFRWATRDVIDPRGAACHADLAVSGEMAFSLAQDIASGRVELDRPDKPRPLFDRPEVPTDLAREAGSVHTPEARAASIERTDSESEQLTFELVDEQCEPHPDRIRFEAPTVLLAGRFAAQHWPDWAFRIAEPRQARRRAGSTDMDLDTLPIVHPPGTELFGCNRCLKVRTRDVPICTDCGCPEFSLLKIGEAGDVLPDVVIVDPVTLPNGSPEPAPKPERKPRGPKTWTIIDGDRGVQKGTVEAPSRAAAQAVAEGRFPGLMRLRVEPREAHHAGA